MEEEKSNLYCDISMVTLKGGNSTCIVIPPWLPYKGANCLYCDNQHGNFVLREITGEIL